MIHCLRAIYQWLLVDHDDDNDLMDPPDNLPMEENTNGTRLMNLPDNLPVEENTNGTRLMNLPDDIVINILCRLPLRCIMNLQTVCKKWLALTSSLHFAETHFKSPVRSQISNYNELDLFLFDKEAVRYKLVKIMSNGFVRVLSEVSPMLVGSCDGLLVFQMFLGSRFLVWDLVTREHTYIDAPANVVPVPSPSHHLSLSAIFSRSSTLGFKLLFSSQIRDHEPGYRYEFFIYESRNNMWRKLPASSYPPTSLINQVVVNPTIYKTFVLWMAPCYVKGLVENPPCRSSVLIFNTDAEDFRSMPHPGNECRPTGLLHKHMYFFVVKEQLYFFNNSFTSLLVWTLEGYDRWYWVLRYSIKLDYVLKAISSSSFPSKTYGFNTATLVKIEGNSVFFRCSLRGLFMYDWGKGITKKLDQEMRGKYVFGSSNNFSYSDSTLSLESGFRCKQRQGRIHGALM